MKAKTKDKQRATSISCKAPDAQSVFLAGTFNNWDPGTTPMERSENGEWSAQLELAPGRYEFKFIVDGEWCCAPGCQADHTCPDCVPNDCGTMNRVLVVE